MHTDHRVGTNPLCLGDREANRTLSDPVRSLVHSQMRCCAAEQRLSFSSSLEELIVEPHDCQRGSQSWCKTPDSAPFWIKHINANGLSRHPCLAHQCKHCDHQESKEREATLNQASTSKFKWIEGWTKSLCSRHKYCRSHINNWHGLILRYPMNKCKIQIWNQS